jgi:hypothetical protein
MCLAAVSLAASGSQAAAATVVSCPFDPDGGGDFLTHGFYVTGYPGASIDQVTLQYGDTSAGTYMITLTARAGTYDGPIIGTKTVSVSLPASSDALTPVSFGFGGAPVTSGSTVTFAQSSSGPGVLFFNVGTGPCSGVTETVGTTPPLDTFHRDSVGLMITGAPPASAPSNAFTLGAITRNTKKGTAKITVNVPNPGELTATGNGVKAASVGRAVISKSVGGGPAQLLIKANGKKKKTLNEVGKVKLNVAITYAPTGGNPSTQSVKVKLKKKL